MKQLVVYLIRHGKTRANENHLYCGKSDIELSKKGIEELEEFKKKIKYPNCEILFSSGAKRANKTIEILYPGKKYEKINKFWEYNFGDFEMKSYNILKENEEYIKWITDNEGKVSCPNGESKIEYRKRIEKAFNMFIKKCVNENINETILVCHGGTIGTILEIFYDKNKSFYEYQPSFGRGYKINLEQVNDKFKIISIANI